MLADNSLGFSSVGAQALDGSTSSRIASPPFAPPILSPESKALSSIHLVRSAFISPQLARLVTDTWLPRPQELSRFRSQFFEDRYQCAGNKGDCSFSSYEDYEGAAHDYCCPAHHFHPCHPETQCARWQYLLSFTGNLRSSRKLQFDIVSALQLQLHLFPRSSLPTIMSSTTLKKNEEAQIRTSLTRTSYTLLQIPRISFRDHGIASVSSQSHIYTEQPHRNPLSNSVEEAALGTLELRYMNVLTRYTTTSYLDPSCNES